MRQGGGFLAQQYPSLEFGRCSVYIQVFSFLTDASRRFDTWVNEAR